VLFLIVFGLASRMFGSLLPNILQNNLGDVLWAAMVFFLFSFLLPQLSTWRLATIAFVFSFFIEVSKLFHAPWFDALRATEIGRLIFGYVFGWSNLVYYLIGIALAATWDNLLARKRLRHSNPTD
jgi:hypothetical protein